MAKTEATQLNEKRTAGVQTSTDLSSPGYHLLLDEHAEQLFAMTDAIAERARKLGGATIRSIGDISKYQRLRDNNEEFVAPESMIEEPAADSLRLTGFLRASHEVCDQNKDVATASLIERRISPA